jgi:hypothetical protein
MHVYYRISDCSYQKNKLPGATKDFCLQNFVNSFSGVPITIICDNVSDENYEFYSKYGTPNRTFLGNAGSLSYALSKAMELPSEEVVYFVEDDYLHKGNCLGILEEGLEHADYATLYDHPDKYLDYGGEVSRVIRTKHSHWRFSISTTMTFATRPKILLEDHDIWEKYTTEFHPHDHLIFSELNQRGRMLAVAIPGLSCHTDLTYTESKQDLFDADLPIENWAMSLLEEEMRRAIYPEEVSLDDKTPLQRLMILQTYLKISTGPG